MWNSTCQGIGTLKIWVESTQGTVKSTGVLINL